MSSSKSGDLRGSSQSREGSEASSQTLLKPSGQLPSLREKAKDFLECSPKDYANFVYEEYRFLAERSKCLCDQLSSLKKKRQNELLKIRKSLDDAQSYHKEVINAFEGRVKAWFQAERQDSFRQASKAGGRKHMERLKELEKAFKDNQKSYKKLHPYQHLQRQNEELKNKIKQPQIPQKASIIQREITSIRRQYQEKNSLFQAKRERAEEQLKQCKQQRRQFYKFLKTFDTSQGDPGLKAIYMETRAKIIESQMDDAKKQVQRYAQNEQRHLRDFYEKILQAFEGFLRNDGASSRSHSIPIQKQLNANKSAKSQYH